MEPTWIANDASSSFRAYINLTKSKKNNTTSCHKVTNKLA